MCGTHAVHLSGTDAGNATVAGHCDGIRTHMLANCHRELQILHLLSGGRLLSDHLDLIILKAFAIKGLAKQTARHAHEHLLIGIGLVGAEGHQTDVLLRGKVVEGLLREGRREDDFEEDGLHRLGGRQVDFAVRSHDAAENRDAVSLVCAGPRLQGALADAHATGILVLHGHHRRAVEFAQDLQCGICILYIVVRQFFTMQLLSPCHGKALLLAGIESSFLMRVLTIAQRLLLGEGKRQVFRLFLTHLLGQIGGDISVVSGSVAENLGSQTTARFQCSVAVSLEFFQHGGIVGIVDHYRHESMVLGRTAQHGRSADVDVFNGILKRSSLFLNSLLERIEVHHHHVDGRNVVGLHLLHVLWIGAHGKQTTVYLRVQSLHATVHNFREAGHIADTDGFHACGLQRFAGAAGRDNFKTQFGKFLSKRHYAFFIAHTDNRSFHTILFFYNCIQQNRKNRKIPHFLNL